MPLTPSPQEVARVEMTQGTVVIYEWSDEGENEQRSVIVEPLRFGDLTYVIEVMVVEELDELIAALQARREFLNGN